MDGIQNRAAFARRARMRQRIKIEPPNITGSAQLRKVEEPSGISSTEAAGSPPLQFRPGFTGGRRGITFRGGNSRV